jgi:acetyl-CoA C-acetyltransferase
MQTAYLVDAVRTPIGRRNGALSGVHSADLGAHALKALVQRVGIDPSLIDDVILGCLDNVGPQAGCIARTSWLAAGLPESVPGVTIDRACGSSQQAVHFATQAVRSGMSDLVVAGGVQNMSAIPMGTSLQVGVELGLGIDPFCGSTGWSARYGNQPVNQFHGAEQIAARWDISRHEMEELALESHRRATAAGAEGRFDNEMIALEGLTADEGPRADTSLEKLRQLKPLSPGGRITAGLASQISDASSAVLIASQRAVDAHHLTPLARIHYSAVVGSDPILMLTGPIAATQKALAATGLTLDDIALVEVNEAFASVVLAWQRELKADLDSVNVNGGAMSLGHPIGASGTRLMASLVNEMRRRGSRFGLQTMCEGGGQANVTILELVE